MHKSKDVDSLTKKHSNKMYSYIFDKQHKIIYKTTYLGKTLYKYSRHSQEAESADISSGWTYVTE